MSQYVLVGWFLVAPIRSSAFGRVKGQEQNLSLFQMPKMVSGPFPRQEPLPLPLMPLPLSCLSLPASPFCSLPSLAQERPGHSSWVWIPYLVLALLSTPATVLVSAFPRCLAALSKFFQPCVVTVNLCSVSRFCYLDPVTLPASFQKQHPAPHLVPRVPPSYLISLTQ